MTKRVQLIRHDNAGSNTFLGRIGEITINTGNKSIHVHDGVSEGGTEQARADLNNVAVASSLNAGKMSAQQAVELAQALVDIVANAALEASNHTTNSNLIAQNIIDIAANLVAIQSNDTDIAALQAKDAALDIVDASLQSQITTNTNKLAGIENGADVTDTANVTAAGALMDSEVDADIKSLSLPANTVISSWVQALLNDTSSSAARATLGLGALALLSTINNGNWSGTDLAVANGGTGSSTASGARSNLGLGSLATLNSVSQANINTNSIGNGELKLSTSTQSVAVTANGISSITLTGGANTTASTYRSSLATPTTNDNIILIATGNGTTYGITGHNISAYSSRTLFSDSVYVPASPPYNLGDGDIPLFCYALIDNGSGLIEATSFAKDPHWAYHGRHNITPDRIDAITGKKYKTVPLFIAEGFDFKTAMQSNNPSIREAALDRLRNKQVEEIELTDAYKNQDMNHVPHPFMHHNLTGKTVVLLDPVSDMVLDMYELHKQTSIDVDNNAHLPELMHNDYIRINNTVLPRTMPNGVIAVTPRWKNTA